MAPGTFAVRGAEGEVILALHGACQGCGLGAPCFILAYELALGRARQRFWEEDITLEPQTP
eukprot:9157367-Pyramimonas_sp.AAC.1